MFRGEFMREKVETWGLTREGEDELRKRRKGTNDFSKQISVY